MRSSPLSGPPREAEALPGSAPWRGDLLRAWVFGDRAALDAAAERHGFGRRLQTEPSEKESQKSDEIRDTKTTKCPTDLARRRPAPTFFWQPVARDFGDDHLDADPEDSAERQLQLSEEHLRPGPDDRAPQPEPIVAWPRLWRALEDRLKSPKPRRLVDVDRLVRRWSRGELVRRLPLRSGLAHARLAIFLDRSERLKPFWGDQVSVTRRLARHLGRDSIRLLPRSLLSQGIPPLAVDERLLIVSDLGLYGGPEASRPWVRLGHRLQRNLGPAAVALLPCPRNRWVGDGPQLFSSLDWSSPDREGCPRPVRVSEGGSAVDQVLRLASVARRLETGLVRELRCLVPDADLGTEADLWAHPAVRSAQAIGIVLEEDRARSLRLEMADLPTLVQARVVSLLARWHKGIAPETWATEVADLLALGVSQEVIGQAEIVRSKELMGRIANLIEAGAGPLSKDADAWFDRLSLWCSRSLWRHKNYRGLLSRAVAARQRRNPESPLPSGLTPEMLGGESSTLPVRRYSIWHEGLEFRALAASHKGSGSFVAEVAARLPRLLSDSGEEAPMEVDLGNSELTWPAPDPSGPVLLVTDVEALELEPSGMPLWARWAGRDHFGFWAAFEVVGVRQRLRWIPPGRFWMGSPQDEAGRFEREGPRHQVTLTEGFWMGETPCTQALWEAVSTTNPSHFSGPEHPVEKVSWDDCQTFLTKLNERVPFLEAELPTEARWEYACRAGIAEATWKGDLETEVENTSAILDEIAWYRGNSAGLEKAGPDRSLFAWRKRPTTEPRRGTHPVGQKEPNPWGLHDMLGNVYEWCSDTYGPYGEERAVDPAAGSKRVIRGGSWSSFARRVRAAYRCGAEPGYRDDYLGFRLVRGPGRGAQEIGRGSAAAEGGTTPRRRRPRPRRSRIAWASASGEDGIGHWAAFEVAGVEQRLRWIEPGTFWMGSQETEAGRWGDEGPRHRVRLTRGFWLGETPCTQALWQGVMGSNPSRFKSPNRPVERVSWEDCQEFLARLAESHPLLNLRLPTEAEWEYACRAKTENATWMGDLKILGENNAPLLDKIAWYGGNSGVGFDLVEGADSSGWPEKQYPHERAGTRPVGQKAPNPWGLRDMLGNVFEWCSDWVGPYSGEHAEGPKGPESGSRRVIRGGSWDSGAQSVRAACRFGDEPGARGHNLGFRLVRGPGGGADER